MDTKNYVVIIIDLMDITIEILLYLNRKLLNQIISERFPKNVTQYSYSKSS